MNSLWYFANRRAEDYNRSTHEKQICELKFNFFGGEGSLEIKLKLTMAFYFSCKEVHYKCLKNGKRKSKKQDDLDTKKNRKRDTEANVLVFSLNAKLSSFYGLFFIVSIL